MTRILKLSPISKEEFACMFAKVRPPSGWSKNIGVAYSGGADSTCLLFLLHQYLQSASRNENDPSRVYGLTVDHDLQSSSASMVEHCKSFATSLGIPFVSSKIDWGNGEFPPRPTAGEKIEYASRLARYHILMKRMRGRSMNTLAFGHHLDDQIETSLMRLARGSTELGAGGMRRCRRWGMDMSTRRQSGIGTSGYEGMNKWIVRPLLDVPKDRILATCEANGLGYVTDKTNFQPELTLRNAVRQLLHNHGTVSQDVMSLPPDIAQHIETIRGAITKLSALTVDIASDPDQLPRAVQHLSAQVESIDEQVNRRLVQARLKSPPGTVILSSKLLSHIKEPLVKQSLILRVMRYVSFHPWGSLRAESNRRYASLGQIVSKLWTSDPFQSGLTSFSSGGGVVWSPIVVMANRILRRAQIEQSGVPLGGTIAWLVTRQPPLSKRSSSILNEGLNYDPLHCDITLPFVDALINWRTSRRSNSIFEILYDCRFLIRINLSQVPTDLAEKFAQTTATTKLLIEPTRMWYLPVILLSESQTTTVLHSKLHNNEPIKTWTASKGIEDNRFYWWQSEKEISAHWIQVLWIRSMDAI